MSTFLVQSLSRRKELLYLKFLDFALSPLKIGSLHVVFPDGTYKKYGTDETIVADLKINNYHFFAKLFKFGEIGFGEAYTEGDWDSTDVTKVIEWMIANKEQIGMLSGSNGKLVIPMNLLNGLNKVGHLLRSNTIKQGQKNIQAHYDLSNEMYQLFLDPTMTYSSALFENESMTLEEAQNHKYQKMADLIKPNSADHILEIGSGWGSNALFLAEKYGCKVTSITLSEKQLEYARKAAIDRNLQDLVQFQLLDYRLIDEKFDKIVSIEMLEAVGEKYFDSYFECLNRCLSNDGVAAIQYISMPSPLYNEYKEGTDWIQKHIFPGGHLPSITRLLQSASKHHFELYQYNDFGKHYARTLRIWFENFKKNKKEIELLGFDEQFYRKWTYYFNYCEAAFETRNVSVVQTLWSRPNNRFGF